MCPVCSGAPAPHWSERCGNATSTTNLRRQRLHRVAVLGELLHDYGISVRIAPGPGGYLLDDRKGASRVVDSAGQLWPALDALTLQYPDPLNPTWLDRIESRTPAAEQGSNELPLVRLGTRFTILLNERLDEIVFALWLDLLLYRHGSESVFLQQPQQRLTVAPISLHGNEELNPTVVRRSLRTFQRLGNGKGMRTT